ncbi:MAG: hypothetical protein IK005_10330, partial [Paludibacteraceae bacterium]|nr:hypothetical protein [Paludibacteraceae bacterium]
VSLANRHLCQIASQLENRRMPNGTYGGVRGQKMKVGRKLSFSSYSIAFFPLNSYSVFATEREIVAITSSSRQVLGCLHVFLPW